MMTLEAEKMEAWDADESALFGAGRSDGPSAESKAGLYAALGLAPPLPGGGGEPHSSPLSAPIPEPVIQSGIFARPIARLAAGAGALAIAIPAFLWTQSEGSDANSQETSAQVEQTQPADRVLAPATDRTKSDSSEATAPPATSDAVAIDSLPPVTDTQLKPHSAGSAKATISAERPTLKEELAHLQRARAELNSGNISQCEALLQEHHTRFVPPRLASEARVLRVEAYVAQGRMAEAKATAAPLLKADSPYRARMETLLSK